MEDNNVIKIMELSSNWHKLDTSKITSLEDVKIILDILDIGISETHPKFNNLKHLLTIKKEEV